MMAAPRDLWQGAEVGQSQERGGDPGWHPFFPPGLGLPPQHNQTPRRASPFPSNSFRSAWEAARAQRPVCGVRGKGQGLWTLAFASSLQTSHFASAIWKFLSPFALISNLRRLSKRQRELVWPLACHFRGAKQIVSSAGGRPGGPHFEQVLNSRAYKCT